VVLRPIGPSRGVVLQLAGLVLVEAARRRDSVGEEDAPVVRRGPAAVRAPAEGRRRRAPDRGDGAVRPQGLHSVPAVRGRGGLQEAEQFQDRPDDAVDVRNLPHLQAGQRGLDLPAAVSQVSSRRSRFRRETSAVVFAGRSRGAALW
jgi:hypothetical protein